MKKHPTLAFLMVLISLCSWSAKKEQPPKEPAGLILTAQVAGSGNKYGRYVIYVSTTLFNPTKDTLRFVTMKCSYSDYFLTDTSAYSIQQEKCYNNYLTILSIPPGYKLDQLIYLVPQETDVIGTVTPRLGMYLQMPTAEEMSNRPFFSTYHGKKENAPIIWSNPIDLNRLHRKPYK